MGAEGCSGVKPEAHEPSWFVEIKGRKRWVLTPPSQPITGNAMRRQPPYGRCCEPRAEHLAEGARVCDVPLGTLLYIPRGWWHETCSLDEYTIGIGGFPDVRGKHASPHRRDRGGRRAPAAAPALWPRLRKVLGNGAWRWSMAMSEGLVARFDKFKSGSLSHQELNDLLHAHGIGDASGDELTELFRFIDTATGKVDAGGMITARELFIRMKEGEEKEDAEESFY